MGTGWGSDGNLSRCIICGAEQREDGSFECSHPFPEGVTMSKAKMYQLKDKTFVNASRTKVVPETSPEAAFLLGPKGHLIDAAYAEDLGLVRKAQSPVEDKAQSPVEDKSVAPEEDKEPVQEEESVEEGEPVEETDEPDIDLSNLDDAERSEVLRTLTIVKNHGHSFSHIPNMLDAELLDIDGISTTRLRTLRKYFPPVSEEDADTAESSPD